MSTLYEWKNKYTEIADALKRGKDVADIEVENALHKRAVGFEYTEVRDEQSAEGKKHVETVKFIPPDVGAIVFWLKNRRADKWRDKPDVDNGDTMRKLDSVLDKLGGNL